MADIQQLPAETDRVVITAEYAHLSPARLFACFTEPALLARWWAPAGAVVGKPGGGYHLWWESMNWHLRGTYSVFVPGERLVLSWKWDHEPEHPHRTVAIDFAPGAGGKGATLTLTHGFYSASDADAEERQGHIDGWLYFLPQIDQVENA